MFATIKAIWGPAFSLRSALSRDGAIVVRRLMTFGAVLAVSATIACVWAGLEWLLANGATAWGAFDPNAVLVIGLAAMLVTAVGLASRKSRAFAARFDADWPLRVERLQRQAYVYVRSTIELNHEGTANLHEEWQSALQRVLVTPIDSARLTRFSGDIGDTSAIARSDGVVFGLFELSYLQELKPNHFGRDSFPLFPRLDADTIAFKLRAVANPNELMATAVDLLGDRSDRPLPAPLTR